MKRTGTITIIVVALLVVTFPFWMAPLCWYAFEQKSTAVTSPDGRHKAWIGTRGWMDSHSSSLYISDADGSHKKSLLTDCIAGELAWSPDSSRVATAAHSRDYSSDEALFLVYNVNTGRHVEAPAKLIGKSSPPCCPVWIGNNKLVWAMRGWTPEDERPECVFAKVRVMDNGRDIKMEDLNKKPVESSKTGN
jgi:hypothetical protein